MLSISLGEKVFGTFTSAVPEERRAASLSPASDHSDRQALILRDWERLEEAVPLPKQQEAISALGSYYRHPARPATFGAHERLRGSS